MNKETHNKIFSMDDVRIIRDTHAKGQETIAETARGHLVSTSTIRRIIKNQTYREDNQLKYPRYR